VSESDRKTQLLVTRIGTESSQDGGSSLWEAVKRTEETVLKGKRKFEEHRHDQIEMGTKYLSLKAKVGETEESMTNLSGHYRLTMEGVKGQLLDLRSSATGVGKPTLGIRDRSGLAHGAAWSKHEVLEEFVCALEKRMDCEAKGGGDGAGPTVYKRAELEGVRSAVNDLDMRIKEVERTGADSCWGEEIKVLRAGMTEMEDRVPDTGFGLDEFHFESKAELRKFIVKEKVAMAGLFWDLFSILVVMKPKKMTGKELADNIYSAIRVSTTILENDLAASMSHDQLALLFGTAEGHIASAEEGLAACLSYTRWIGKSCESYRLKLTKLLKNYAARSTEKDKGVR
jgi:hypothetical protein